MEEMKNQQRIFFEFLRFCIGTVQEVPSSLKGADWRVLYAMARKQCLVGVLFDGIKRLPADVGMDKGLLFQWMAQNQTLRKANARLDKAAVEVAEWFGRKGFRTCVLKGQGNALLYPPGMERTPGDIDLWVDGGDSRQMRRSVIIISVFLSTMGWKWRFIFAPVFYSASGTTGACRGIMSG